jgi:hypothetical protein
MSGDKNNFVNKFTQFKNHHQLIIAIIVGGSVISFWRGIWGLMDIFFFSNNNPLSYLLSIFVGIFVLVMTHFATKKLL